MSLLFVSSLNRMGRDASNAHITCAMSRQLLTITQSSKCFYIFGLMMVMNPVLIYESDTRYMLSCPQPRNHESREENSNVFGLQILLQLHLLLQFSWEPI